jgi:hypothetical protein
VESLEESGDNWLGRSIKNRSVDPREQVLNVPITCR